jgi:hypothetical protein
LPNKFDTVNKHSFVYKILNVLQFLIPATYVPTAPPQSSGPGSAIYSGESDFYGTEVGGTEHEADPEPADEVKVDVGCDTDDLEEHVWSDVQL